MSRLFVFADEAGNFDFSRNPGASRYFIVCTICCDACEDLGSSLLALRRHLVWNEEEIGEYFHAAKDRQTVRDAVFDELKKHKFSIQATIMEKSKSQPHIRSAEHRFYQYGWFYHFKHAGPAMLHGKTELLVTTASIGTKADKGRFSGAVNDVVQQILRSGHVHKTNFCPSMGRPMFTGGRLLYVGNSEKMELKDTRSYDLIGVVSPAK